MRRTIFVATMMFFVLSACNQAKEEATPEKAPEAKQEKKVDDAYEMQKAMGRQVAVQWLAFGDEGNWGATWDNAARTFQQALPKPKWEAKAVAVREPLGALVERKILVVKYETSLPGAPDGEYVVIQFNARYENKAHAVETVSVVKEDDGMWRVTGYFIN